MQNAKDSFYITLRNRLATVNPNRTMTLRGITRPGILVEDAEAPMPQMLLDAFTLRWTKLETDTQLPSILAQIACEIHYATAGTQGNMELDRGRALEEMDDELLQILCPSSTPKYNYTTTPATQMGTMIFWSQALFSTTTITRERLERVATVNVFAFQEQGEA
ncbi:hypothetical protein [Silvibacterium dinghuense]|uniref:Uncharacterized protein n=1 Tax=Silvibacterium dinghuense TaxID=1560006 RepID=A0A4V1NW06_9BACT|nr:hypothetical protein [Silvibacterium dinghuense]RXS97752.1 hypothetical protein ESZ00_07785 [Silvibacterium dinghuense]GGH01746.1 hypothetical protein GCM10011586_16770 [Silvibacterium dinghuense]